MKILFFDRDLLEARPLSRFRSIFAYRDGIYSPLERVMLEHPGAELFYYHAHEHDYEMTIAQGEGLRSWRAAHPGRKADQAELVREFDLILDSKDLSPFDLLDRVGARVAADVKHLDFEPAAPPPGVTVVGATAGGAAGSSNDRRLYLHPTAEILPGSVLDLSGGPIVIGAETRITPFCYLAGPLVVGRQCHVDDARIGDSILGHQVRVGGEIENSILGDFTNKHHEGFVGHSIIGRWVNLGALTTTSDLKNNYGSVRLEIPSDFYPAPGAPRQTIDSGRIKFGSIVGDAVKTAIGTLLNTGTVLDAGSNVFGGSPGKYLAPLSWGLKENSFYDPERFLADCAKIFARRSETPDAALRDQVERLAAGLRTKPRRGLPPLRSPRSGKS